jgi:hypothetical protein
MPRWSRSMIERIFRGARFQPETFHENFACRRDRTPCSRKALICRREAGRRGGRKMAGSSGELNLPQCRAPAKFLTRKAPRAAVE